MVAGPLRSSSAAAGRGAPRAGEAGRWPTPGSVRSRARARPAAPGLAHCGGLKVGPPPTPHSPSGLLDPTEIRALGSRTERPRVRLGSLDRYGLGTPGFRFRLLEFVKYSEETVFKGGKHSGDCCGTKGPGSEEP